MLSPGERTLRARLAAYRMHAGGGTNTKPARAAWEARFERQVDPDGTLSPAERARRAAAAEKAHYTEMAYKSARARSKKAAKKAPTVADTSAGAMSEVGHGHPDPTSSIPTPVTTEGKPSPLDRASQGRDTSTGLRATLEAAMAAGYSMEDLTVLAAQNDPYRVDTLAGHRDGRWLAVQAERLSATRPPPRIALQVDRPGQARWQAVRQHR